MLTGEGVRRGALLGGEAVRAKPRELKATTAMQAEEDVMDERRVPFAGLVAVVRPADGKTSKEQVAGEMLLARVAVVAEQDDAPAVGRAGKRIMHISSDLASMSLTSNDLYAPYRMSKSALNMLGRMQAAMLGPRGFTVVTVHPGWMRTDMGGPNAIQDPAMVADKLAEMMCTLDPSLNGAYLDFNSNTMPW